MLSSSSTMDDSFTLDNSSSSLEMESSKPKAFLKQRTMQEFRTGLLELHKDLQILEPFYKETEVRIEERFSSHQLDMCFIVDITGSMSSWMQQTRDYIRSTF